MRESYKSQRPSIAVGLHALGVTQISSPDSEADDLAALYAQKMEKAGNAVLLVTGDKDWLQLLGNKVAWFDPRFDKMVNIRKLKEETKCENVDQFVQMKALMGDASDTITGVGGIGEKGALDLFEAYGSVGNFFKMADNGELPKKLGKVLSRFANNEPSPKYGVPMRDAYYRNLQLMDLRQAEMPGRDRIRVIRSTCSRDKFIAFCEQFGFVSILREMDGWMEIFEAA